MSIQTPGGPFRAVLAGLLALCLSSAAMADHLQITRAFSGIWDQPDHQSQGFILQISETGEGEKVAVVYWFTYGGDLLSSWYIGVGPVEGHEIPLTLYLSLIHI